MDVDPLFRTFQPTQVADDDQKAEPLSSGSLEVILEVWGAAEALTSPELETRWQGVKRLVEIDAPRKYSLVAYLLATRLTEPVIELRARVVEALADVLTHDPQRPLQPAVYNTMIHALGAMRQQMIRALLQVASFDTTYEPRVAALLSYCSYAGEHLADILNNRDEPVEIRWQASHFIGRLGFLDALPALERLAVRIETRLNGRSADYDDFDEANLLLEMRQAIAILRAP